MALMYFRSLIKYFGVQMDAYVVKKPFWTTLKCFAHKILITVMLVFLWMDRELY